MSSSQYSSSLIFRSFVIAPSLNRRSAASSVSRYCIISSIFSIVFSAVESYKVGFFKCQFHCIKFLSVFFGIGLSSEPACFFASSSLLRTDGFLPMSFCFDLSSVSGFLPLFITPSIIP